MKTTKQYLLFSIIMISAIVALLSVGIAEAMDSATNQPSFNAKSPRKKGAPIRAQIEVITPDHQSSLKEGVAAFTGECPATFKIRGVITSTKPGDVTYTYLNNEGHPNPTFTVNFEKPGAKTVETKVILNGSVKAWRVLRVLTPAQVDSNKAEFSAVCNNHTTATHAGNSSNAGKPVTPQKVSNKSRFVEDCLTFTPQRTISYDRNGALVLADSDQANLALGVFPRTKLTETNLALDMIRNYGFTQHCVVKPGMEYWLVSGQAPSGPQPNEDCMPFNLETVAATNENGTWQVGDGEHVLFKFGNNEASAKKGESFIKKYGFTNICYVGRPYSKFTYLRK